MSTNAFSTVTKMLDEIDEAGLYILCRKKGGKQIWMLALIMKGDRFATFYYYDHKSDANGGVKVVPEQVWKDENLTSKHFLKNLTYPHLVGQNGFHKSALSVHDAGDDKSYIVRVLLILEQRFLVPDRSYSDWNEIWRYPPSTDSGDSDSESFTLRESELLAKYPANDPDTDASKSSAPRRCRSPTPVAQAGPSSDLAAVLARSMIPATPAGASSARVRDRPGIDAAKAGPSSMPAMDVFTRTAKKARSMLQTDSPKKPALSTVQSGPPEVRPRSTVRTGLASRKKRAGFQSPLRETRVEYSMRGDIPSSSAQPSGSRRERQDSDLDEIGSN